MNNKRPPMGPGIPFDHGDRYTAPEREEGYEDDVL